MTPFPRFCNSELHREYSGAFVNFLVRILARKTEVGARTLAFGASAGEETHGQYVPDCKIKTTLKGLGENSELQHRVWAELQKKLEHIQPGVTSLP